MSLVAAFLWKKTPRHSISTFIYDEDTIEILSPPQIYFFSGKLFSFRKEAKSYINQFIAEVAKLTHKPIRIEYKIVFTQSSVPWIRPSSQSKFVLNYFINSVNKLQRKLGHIQIQPQLRKNLSGRSLKLFKRELRKMKLVSRKKGRSFEYYLWVIGLHATSISYEKKLRRIKKKLFDKFWNEPSLFK